LRFLEFLFTMGCAYGIQEPSQARKRMIDRAPLPDFELPATGTPRFQLSAFKATSSNSPSIPGSASLGCAVGRTHSSTTPLAA